ncbi:Mu transposase C-terminal domain-containing protein [Paracoccus ravus]|uniref:Mu transposase C-terminal domain-containing protein n=1 Tax=Paracoccus ravus TaxID=2447760 RepID=UPI00106EA544|nr:Mu transposase C-terminal domain-containing protein [Paracoccus ravus]
MLDFDGTSQAPMAFVARKGAHVLLRCGDGAEVEVEYDRYREMIANGQALRPGDDGNSPPIHDEHARNYQAMIQHAITRDKQLRRSGRSAKEAHRVLSEELRSHPVFAAYAPAMFSLRTLQNWKTKLAREGKAALTPKFAERGNRGARYDELYRKTVFDVLERNYLQNDRLAIWNIVPQVRRKYEVACKAEGREPGNCDRRCLEAVIATIRADDVVSARHDSQTSKKFLLQSQFYHRVHAPLDLVEIDCTKGDIHLADAKGNCVGRPFICAAVCAATGFPWIRASLDAPNETLVIQTIRDVMTMRGCEYFDFHEIPPENRIEAFGTPKVISTDQGSENSGSNLNVVVENAHIEFAKNIPGCPEKKPFVERFFRELNRFLQTLPGSSHSKDLPNRQRTAKGMKEATLTLDELQKMLVLWVYNSYIHKIRRLIHSPLRQAESPAASWNRLAREVTYPSSPRDLDAIFMIESRNRKVHSYGIAVGGIHYHSSELRDLIGQHGIGTNVTILHDPTNSGHIMVKDPLTGQYFAVPAKADEATGVSLEEGKARRKADPAAKEKDRQAREYAADLADNGQNMAKARGKAKPSRALKDIRKAEQRRQRHKEINATRNSGQDSSKTSAIDKANRSTPRLPIRLQSSLPEIDKVHQE